MNFARFSVKENILQLYVWTRHSNVFKDPRGYLQCLEITAVSQFISFSLYPDLGQHNRLLSENHVKSLKVYKAYKNVVLSNERMGSIRI